jgi:hypothetical protein
MEVVPKEIPIPKSSNVQETTTENDDDVEVIPEEIPIPESSKVQETTKKESDNDGHFSRDEVLVRIEKLVRNNFFCFNFFSNYNSIYFPTFSNFRIPPTIISWSIQLLLPKTCG